MIRLLKSIFLFLYNLKSIHGTGNIIKGLPCRYSFWGMGKWLSIYGDNNLIDCRTDYLGKVKIKIHGNDHHLIIGENVIYKSGSIWFEDYGCCITIGKNTTIENADFAVAESQTSIIVGEDSMLSSGIRLSTTDSHSIIDLETGERTNKAASIIVGNHVWLGRNSNINKGVVIYDNSVVAGNTLLTHNVESGTIVGGVPGKVLRTNISWLRDRI